MVFWRIRSGTENKLSFDDLVRESNSTKEENSQLIKYWERFSAYLLAPRIRKILSRKEQSLEKQKTFYTVINEGKKIKELTESFSNRVKKYYHAVIDAGGSFAQKRHLRLSEKFAANIVSNTKKILSAEEKSLDLIRELTNKISSKETQNRIRELRKVSKEITNRLEDNEVLIGDAVGRIQIESNLVHQYEDIRKYLIDKSRIETGDILLSFKSKEFFGKTAWFRRVLPMITMAMEKSSITHAAVCAQMSGGLKFIDAMIDIGVNGVAIRDFEIRDGEVFVVLRSNINANQKIMLLGAMRKYIQEKSKYSVLKLAGLLPTMVLTSLTSIFSGGYKQIPNFMGERKSEFFCSEFVNQVFLEAGVMLTPKSRYGSTVSPPDIATSPYLKFIGLVFKDSERTEEIVTRYFKKKKVKI